MKDEPPPARAPKSGLLLMAIIVGAMAIVAVHANIQKLRRANVETVVVKPLAAPREAGSPSPLPSAPAP